MTNQKVGVDIGCGMIATRTTLKAKHLPDSLKVIRENIEQAIPHGIYNCFYSLFLFIYFFFILFVLFVICYLFLFLF
jgi:hypothetical protein